MNKRSPTASTSATTPPTTAKPKAGATRSRSSLGPALHPSKRSVPAEEFVRVWSAASSLSEAAATLGMSRAATKSRASVYRRRYAIDLKFMPQKRLLDQEALKKLATQLGHRAAGKPKNYSKAERARRRARMIALNLRRTHENPPSR